MRALLLDLDDTLLANSMDTFIPAYFSGLARWANGHVDGELLIEELLRATRAVQANDGSGPTNAEVFNSHFYPALGSTVEELEPLFARYYEEAFGELQRLTSPRPSAVAVVEWAFSKNLEVVIATNPVFPKSAVEQRLSWADLPVTAYPFRLVTTFENMHATKDHPAYYREILDVIGCRPADCMMVGDSFWGDVVQPGKVGIPGFWIAEPDDMIPDPAVPIVGRGSLADCFAHLRQTVGP